MSWLIDTNVIAEWVKPRPDERVVRWLADADEDRRLLDPRTESARVRAMFVRSDWTRRGLGRAILESCERAARDEGFTSMSLGATLPGVALYRAFGFSEVEKFVVTMPDGGSVDAIAMERPILPRDSGPTTPARLAQ